MRGCEQWPLPDLETKSGIVLFFQLKHKHKPTKDSRLVWKFQLCTNYSSCGFVDFLYKNGSGGITHMTLEWKEPNKSQLWWRDPVEREKREGCLIWTMPFPLFPWAFSTGGWDKAALNSKSCLSMIGAIKKPAVQLAVKDHLHSLYPATHLFLDNTPVRLQSCRVTVTHPTSFNTPDSTQQKITQ